MNQVFPGRGDPTGTDTQAVKCSVLVLNLGLSVKGLGFVWGSRKCNVEHFNPKLLNPQNPKPCLKSCIYPR